MAAPALSGVEPETLSFLSADRYPTDAANALAEHHGLALPDTIPALKRWADYLALRQVVRLERERD